ncbi:AsmA family protein [Acidisphaera sp. L21]|uniref:AsmA family protein n=1 Tax=Acidisphaera sp. L21 TaxID=1641851 RepID=UPI00131B2603|nr:AsmA family protein [Acidisphaera sp. L21]
MPSDTMPAPPRRSRHIWAYVLGTVVVATVAAVALWDWDWFLPIVDAQASSALGRKVTAQHLHVQLGRTTVVVLDGVKIASADGYQTDKPFATADRLTVQADVMAYIHTRQIVIPQIVVDKPVIDAEQNAKGEANWPAPASSSTPTDKPADPDAGPKIGQLVIKDGSAHVEIAKVKANFDLDIATRAGAAAGDGGSNAGQIVVKAKGRYANQPITGELVGGALLSLRDTSQPYPIDLHIANGPTRVVLTGSVKNPLNFAGADLKLQFSGPDMALLTPLTGVPIPETPAYSIAGKLDYADKKVRFTGFTGRLGNSDLNGDILVDPTRERPFVDANLFSRRVELADLGGFIGETPGRKGEANQSAQQKTELAKKESSDRILPDTPINLPKLNMADVKLRYKGAHIEGRSVPLDNIVANLDITNGRVVLNPLSFGVGTGQIAIATDLQPVGKNVKANASVEFKRVDLARLLSATHLVEGAGAMSGSARLDSTGDSLASLLGHGDGGLKLGMSGGNLSALLVDIAGLAFGNAILSALGIPQRADLQCFAADFVLNKGQMSTRTMILDTSEARVQGTGGVNLADETIDYTLSTATKHFSVGSLPTPIDIKGKLSSPGIRPHIGPLALRGGAAIGLGVLFPPAALLPTIQFGTGDDDVCKTAEAPIARSTPASIPSPGAAVRRGRPAPRRVARR